DPGLGGGRGHLPRQPGGLLPGPRAVADVDRARGGPGGVRPGDRRRLGADGHRVVNPKEDPMTTTLGARLRTHARWTWTVWRSADPLMLAVFAASAWFLSRL